MKRLVIGAMGDAALGSMNIRDSFFECLHLAWPATKWAVNHPQIFTPIILFLSFVVAIVALLVNCKDSAAPKSARLVEHVFAKSH